ncbi:MAG: ERF family protein [Pirellulales bacterium]
MSIHEKLLAIQTSLKAPKGQRNTFGNYNYRSCEDILEALKPLLKEHGCYLTLSDEIVHIGNRFYVKATASIVPEDVKGTDAHTVSIIKATAYAREEETKKGMDGAQITGAASSYARKYALNGLFCIDDTKDADTMDNTKEGAKKASAAGASSTPALPKQRPSSSPLTASEGQLQLIASLAKDLGKDPIKDIYEPMKITSGLPSAKQADDIIRILRVKKDVLESEVQLTES